ncbi:MAG: hypothetical protein LBS82_03685 [Spirochaetaceae bacterium]|jgi:hypothetical protein|nr:hypothetical protein [Spirochaetaceae bacterium]
MKKHISLLRLLTPAIAVGVLFVGCISAPKPSPSEALDAIGVNRAQELQYYVEGGNIALTLVRSKNGQTDGGAKVSKGEASYVREQIVIPMGTKGVAVQQKTSDDGTPMLGISFEDDASKLLWFIQDTKDFTPLSHFVVAADASSIVSYDNAFYQVSGQRVAQQSLLGAMGGAAPVVSSGIPTLGIVEDVKVNYRAVKGKALK